MLLLVSACRPFLKYLIRKTICNLECYENKIFFIVGSLNYVATGSNVKKGGAKLSHCTILVWSGGRVGSCLWEKFNLLITSFRSSGGASSSSVLEKGWTMLELVPRGNVI